MAEIYAVASGKGGVGKSTFTAGISRALSEAGKRVLATATVRWFLTGETPLPADAPQTEP